MRNNIPSILDNHKICIICEGNEEYAYLDRLKQLKVWNSTYEVVMDNACGNGNIPARYQDRYQNGAYELILVFCDTEKKPYEQFEDIKRKINEFHGVNNAAKEVIIYANPCTMQIIIKHWGNDTILKPKKLENAPLIKAYTGIENYKARADQLTEIVSYITKENYLEMKERVEELEDMDGGVGSSNFGRFIRLLECEDVGWIEDINDKLDK